jgi:leucyl aminopeptidase
MNQNKTMGRMLKDISEQVGQLFLDNNATQTTRFLKGLSTLNGEAADSQTMKPRHLEWLKAINFKPRPGQWALLPGEDTIEGAVFGVAAPDTSEPPNPLRLGMLPPVLPTGDYHYADTLTRPDIAALAWALGAYTFQRYKAEGSNGERPRLRLPEGVSRDDVVSMAASVWLARDLINTPANDLGPAELAEAVADVTRQFGANCKVTLGEDLAENFPLIHAVGRASTASRAPCLIDVQWGKVGAPKITLVGKGICFDSGGLDLKPSAAMLLMKKDVGGAATALALAAMIMAANLPIRLRLIIAAAENAVSGEAFRPGDILKSRSGKTIEIGNTDAEGRLVLADALTLADEDKPDDLISFATLTGAARAALGPDLPPVFSTDSGMVHKLMAAGRAVGDPMWSMPFWSPYNAWVNGKLADLANMPSEPGAGAIVAALFLKRFVKEAKRYVHFDIFGWTPKAQAGKPMGGEPQCARAVFEYLKGQFKQQ